MGRTLFTDADNTLWETNAVWARAQLVLLRDMEQVADAPAPAADDDGLAYLRAVDQRIAAVHPDGNRYPPLILGRALRFALSGDTADDAARRALRDEAPDEALAAAVGRFTAGIRAVPELRPGVRQALGALHAQRVPVVIVTETGRSHCKMLVAAHGLGSFVTRIECEKKTPELYARLRQPNGRPMMVGDQLDRDIAYAQPAGYETVFYPGGFQPYWLASVKVEPDHRIHRYDEVVALLN
jgi:putative hydrolase of the HAD superfamily